MRRYDQRRKIWALGLFVLSMSLTGGLLAGIRDNGANATLAGWNPGDIMSDFIMTDYSSMTEAEIQSFLKSKNPCNDTRLYIRDRSPNTHWNVRDGHFVCMADDTFDGETAAHIIWQAAQDYRINPRVLIVLLQKESGLITDTLPNDRNYKTAAGYGCPDTAPCDAQYYGLKNQIRNAARFFRAYQDNNPNWYKPYWIGTKQIYWHPNGNCGTSTVTIANKTTASLYSYTPYRPNQAALNAGWGTGDACSSYGNRNFYNYYTDWFGDTHSNLPNQRKDQITKYYNSLGGTKSFLGAAVGEPECFSKSGDAQCKQKYQNGYIYASMSGAWDVSYGVLEHWLKLGAENGALGWPTSTEIRNLNNGGAFQAFSGGSIYWTARTGAQMVRGGILDGWKKIGLEWSDLGYPISGERVDQFGTVYQEFENGRIYWTAKDGAWTIRSSVLGVWNAWGGANGYLGKSLDFGSCKLTKGGCYQPFKNGSVYWTQNGGAHLVRGGMLNGWYKTGLEWGSLGYPLSGEKTDHNGTVYQQFENGRIYWTAQYGNWVIREFAVGIWNSYGGAKSFLGRSLNAGNCGLTRGGCYQPFQNGSIYWTQGGGAHIVRGGILDGWYKTGLEWGALGYPISDERVDQNGVYQQFERGKVYWSTQRGSWVVK